jgi:hypothetical protein
VLRCRSILPVVLCAALALPALAGAATKPSVAFQRGCYLDTAVDGKANFTVRGFPARTTVSESLDGKQLGTDVVPPNGVLTRSVPVPAHTDERAESTHVLTVSAGSRSATATLRTTSHLANFSPSAGDPRKLRVRFSVYGMRVPQASASKAYVHYVSPSGKLRRTLLLGKVRGGCGHITRSAKKKLFPFTPAGGRWTLQFDTRKHFTPSNATSPFAWATVGIWVTVTKKHRR